MNSISTRRRLVAVLLLPVLLVLAGCGKLHADFEIQDADTINVSYDLAIDEEFAAGVYDSAEEMCAEMEGEMSTVGEIAPSVAPYEENGQLGCLVTGVMTSDNYGAGFSLTEEGGEYHLVIDGDEGAVEDLDAPEMAQFDLDFRMTFTFPGEVLESRGGQVDGNSVTFTDLAEVAQGVDVRADAGGFPWVILVVVVLVLGLLLLLALAAVAFFVLRARNKRTGGGSGPAGGSGVPAGYGAAGGAAAAGMPPAAPQGVGGQQSPQWGQASPPPAAPQPGQQGRPWGQASPPPAAPQPGQQGQPWSQAPQGAQPWDRPGGPQDQGGSQDQGGQPWDRPDQGRPPQAPTW
jgi:hypothetical protein